MTDRQNLALPAIFESLHTHNSHRLKFTPLNYLSYAVLRKVAHFIQFPGMIVTTKQNFAIRVNRQERTTLIPLHVA